MPLEIAIETITPEKAQAWLSECNIGNRKLRVTSVEAYASDMASGRWKLTADPIRFNGSVLLDGQHRLAACVKANVPFQTAVARGVSEDAHIAIDAGAKRSVADELRYRGEVNVNLLAAVLTFVYRYDTDRMIGWRGGIPRSSLFDLLAQHPEIRDSTRKARIERPLVPASSIATTHFLASRDISMDEADGWLDRYKSDVGFDDGDPVLALRRYAENMRGQRTLRPSPEEWLAVSIKSFNHWLAGNTIRYLRWRRGGVTREAFPRIAPVEPENTNA